MIAPVGGEPGTAASAAAFLAPDEDGFVTGTTLVVDGGMSATMGI